MWASQVVSQSLCPVHMPSSIFKHLCHLLLEMYHFQIFCMHAQPRALGCKEKISLQTLENCFVVLLTLLASPESSVSRLHVSWVFETYFLLSDLQSAHFLLSCRKVLKVLTREAYLLWSLPSFPVLLSQAQASSQSRAVAGIPTCVIPYVPSSRMLPP